jgi:hypothetical protein
MAGGHRQSLEARPVARPGLFLRGKNLEPVARRKIEKKAGAWG